MTDTNRIANELIGVMKAAGVNFDSGFAAAFSVGFQSERYGNVARDALDEIDRITRVGINLGYTGDMKKALRELTELIVDATREKRGGVTARDENKLRERLGEITGKLKLADMSRANAVKKFALKNIDDAIRSIPMYEKESPNMAESLARSRELLEEIREGVMALRDGSSEDALAKAEAIGEVISRWRDQASGGVLTVSEAERLGDASEIVREWAALCAPAKARTTVKPDDGRVAFGGESFDPTPHIEKLEMLKENIRAYKGRLDEQYSTEIYDKRIEELDGDISAADKEIKRILGECKNGRMSAVDAKTKCARLEEKKKKAKEKRALQERNRERQLNDRDRAEAVVEAVEEHIIQPLDNARITNMRLFRTITEGPSPALKAAMEKRGINTDPINFAAVMKLARGVIDNEGLVGIIVQIKNIMVESGVGDRIRDDFLSQLGAVFEMSEEALKKLEPAREEISPERETEEDKRKAAKEEEDALRWLEEQYGGADEEGEEEDTVEIRDRHGLSDGDL